MRISGPNGPTAATGSTFARRSASGSFSLPQDEPAATPTAAGGVRTVAGIDALLALQGVEAVDERRRRAVKRGHTALDLLDEMKLALLSGRLEPSMLARLKTAAADLKETSGDPRVDQVLAEIDLRVEVELAKATTSAA
ncbi:MAG TPA: flagellar assembly protein FliX [Xanthobacteraceae bacterium]